MRGRPHQPRYGGQNSDSETSRRPDQLTLGSEAEWRPLLLAFFKRVDGTGHVTIRQELRLELQSGRSIHITPGTELVFYPATDHKENKSGRAIDYYSIFCPGQIATCKHGRFRLTPVSTPPAKATFRPSNHTH